MAYSEIEMFTNDIDWFVFDIDSKPIHVASAGGVLPNAIKENNIMNEHNIEVISTLPEVYSDNDIIINPRLRDIIGIYLDSNIFEELALRNYISSFLLMAKRGFYSFDKTKIEDSNDTHYHLVAYPKHFDSNLLNDSKIERYKISGRLPIWNFPFNLFDFFEDRNN